MPAKDPPRFLPAPAEPAAGWDLPVHLPARFLVRSVPDSLAEARDSRPFPSPMVAARCRLTEPVVEPALILIYGIKIM